MQHRFILLAALTFACEDKEDDSGTAATTSGGTTTATTSGGTTSGGTTSGGTTSGGTTSGGTTTGGTTTGGTTTGGPTSGGTSGLPGLSHAVDIQPIWNKNCVVCHEPNDWGGPSAGLDLTDGYAAMVQVDATTNGVKLPLVAPGSPQNSFVIYKLSDTQAKVGDARGNPMPPPGTGEPFTPLAQPDLDKIAQWIINGANP